MPGVDDWLFERIKVPTLIIAGGAKDIDHPKRTSLEVSCLIEGSTLIEPPWREDAWEHAARGATQVRPVHHVRHMAVWSAPPSL